MMMYACMYACHECMYECIWHIKGDEGTEGSKKGPPQEFSAVPLLSLTIQGDRSGP